MARFTSLRDFFHRTGPTPSEMLNLIRAGAFDGFGEPRTSQFWHLQRIAQRPNAQGFVFQSDEISPLPTAPLIELDQFQRLRDEMELLGFTVSGHPLDQFASIAWDTYCPSPHLAAFQNGV